SFRRARAPRGRRSGRGLRPATSPTAHLGDASMSPPLLIPGATCWKTVRADRFALIQDAGPAFTAMADAMEAARRSIFILGWDIDSRVLLRPVEGARPVDPGRADGRGCPLLPFLLDLLDRRPELEVFILLWSF